MTTMRAVPRRYTSAEYEKAMALHRDEGFGAVKIEEILGIPKGAVAHWIYEGGKPREQRKKIQIQNKNQFSVSYEQRLDLLEEMLRKGAPVRDAAAQTGTRIGRVNLMLGSLLLNEDIPIVGEILDCRKRGMSLDQIGTQLFINKGVLIKALVLDQLKKDAYFDREKLALELGVDQATVKKTANRIIAARPDVFPLVTCPRCHRSVRQNEIDPTVGLVGMCSGCRIEVEMILNQMSDLNIAYTKGGNLVNHRWGGYDKWAVDPRRFDREKNTLEWESLVGKLEKEKPSETFGEYPEIEEVECIA